MKLTFLFFFLILINFSGFSQTLHHQTLAAQGGTFKTSSGIIVRQSVGQMSAIGNATAGKVVLQQGFQQSLISKFFPVYNVNKIATSLYPNPFIGPLNVSFSVPLKSDVSVSLFNMFGVSLFSQTFTAPQSVLNFDFGSLPAGSYVLHLTSDNYSFSKTIIKL
jgi:hypothetical protein